MIQSVELLDEFSGGFGMTVFFIIPVSVDTIHFLITLHVQGTTWHINDNKNGEVSAFTRWADGAHQHLLALVYGLESLWWMASVYKAGRHLTK